MPPTLVVQLFNVNGICLAEQSLCFTDAMRWYADGRIEIRRIEPLEKYIAINLDDVVKHKRLQRF